MDRLAFTVPGEVRGKGRPRIGKIGNHARMFTDKKTANYESLVALAAEKALAGRPPFDCALEVHIRVRLIPAPSASKKARAAMLAGEIPPTKKPDLDNVVKAILDGCNAVAFRDDVLVVAGSQCKRYAATAGVDVLIKPYIHEAA
jgi:Holliday junction resolvase RusA-like endonuclease